MNAKHSFAIENRRHVRLNGGFDTTIKTECIGEKNVTCENISQGGVFLRIPFNKFEQPKISLTCLKYEKIDLRIKLRDTTDEIKIIGALRWGQEIRPDQQKINKDYGLGIEFIDIQPTDKEKLDQYIFNQLSKKFNNNSNTILNKKANSTPSAERRTSNRLVINVPINLKIDNFSARNSISISGQTVNISEGGAGVYLNSPINNGSIAKLNIIFLSNYNFQTDVKVKWVNNEYNRCGLEFLDPNLKVLKEALREINLKQIESFLGHHLPDHVKNNYEDSWVYKKMEQKEIMDIIGFTPPFLKIKKFLIGNTKGQGLFKSRGLGIGILTLNDTKGHYNDTIFLAFCGLLMASTASIHLAALLPKTAPQVVEAIGVRPIISLEDKKHIWKPNQNGTKFFVETQILRKKMALAIVNTRITFSNILYGTVDELKIIITPGDSIYSARAFPDWK